MNDEEFIRAARVLSSDHGLRVLRAFADDRWKIASEISSDLDIHTSTASKYLAQLHKQGLLERRIRKTGRRSTHEYHLRHSTLLLELDLAGKHEIVALECWDACLELFHQLISVGEGHGFAGFVDEVEQLITSLQQETGLRNLCLFDPKCDVAVAKRLVRKKLDRGQLSDSVSAVKETSAVVFEAMKAICLEKIGSEATKELFESVLSEFGREDEKAIRELGLTGTLERGFANA
jgi:DNA-binding MarR family transcriptional regulator